MTIVAKQDQRQRAAFMKSYVWRIIFRLKLRHDIFRANINATWRSGVIVPALLPVIAKVSGFARCGLWKNCLKFPGDIMGIAFKLWMKMRNWLPVARWLLQLTGRAIWSWNRLRSCRRCTRWWKFWSAVSSNPNRWTLDGKGRLVVSGTV